MRLSYGIPMKALDLDGAWIFAPPIHLDSRGAFREWFKRADVERLTGRSLEIAQANCSVSRHGVVRGIHFSSGQPGQAKLVTCASGAILDVVVDLRVGSPDFGRWIAVPLSAENGASVFIEEGLGHGFATLSSEATVVYLCSAAFDPGHEHGVNPFDSELGVGWSLDGPAVLSAKDAEAPSLGTAITRHLLPDYARCKASVAALRARGNAAGAIPVQAKVTPGCRLPGRAAAEAGPGPS